MSAGSAPAVPRRRLVLLLGGTAGYLDAVGYLTVGLFTANMTGNTVLFGIAIGQGHWHAALRGGLAILCFVAGAVGSTLLFHRFRRIGSALVLEAAFIAAALAAWIGVGRPYAATISGTEASVLIALLSAAMGVQSGGVRRVGEVRVSTTYVTGTLTTLAVDAATELINRWGARITPQAEASISLRKATPLLFGIWSTYVGGALVGGFAEQQWGFWSVAAPVAAVAMVGGWDLLRPTRPD